MNSSLVEYCELIAMVPGFNIRDRKMRIAIVVLVLTTLAIIVFASSKVKQDIPLSSIITTSPQSDMRYFDDVLADQEMEDFKRKLLSSYSNSATAFLVDAVTEKDAIYASAGVLFGSKPTDKAVSINSPTSKRESHWLVVFLGLGPSYPTSWVIERASVSANEIRLTYQKPTARTATADIHHYYYWVPLGELKPGVYRVELFDAGLKEVTLSRRVEVREEKRQ